MYIKAIKLIINTEQGKFGFFVEFSRNLTILKGKNSSGKSTLINSLIYGLGMEELVGGKGEKVLPYALKDYFEYENNRINVISSEVYLELQNNKSELITIKRSIKDEIKNTKLVEVSNGGYLTSGDNFVVMKSLYLHDAGSAQIEEGFYRYLEGFIGFNLPRVPTTSGGEAKLYLQTIFAALFVEQKRGWSDYIAGIPFYGIREARLRVVEYLLNLNVFESAALKNKLDAESLEISNEWISILRKLQILADDSGVLVNGVPQKVSADFDTEAVYLEKLSGSEKFNINDYLEKLRDEYGSLEERALHFQKATNSDVSDSFDKAMDEVQKFTSLYESNASQQLLNNASLREYEGLLAETKEDLAKNKAALKLKSLGAKSTLSIASDICPTCHQDVEDSLLIEIVSGPQMDLETNINYLERQLGMLEAQVNGIKTELDLNEVSKLELLRVMTTKREFLNAIRMDVATGAVQSRANIKRQMQIDDEVNKLEKLEDSLTEYLKALKKLSNRLIANQTSRKQLPKSTYSNEDEVKISHFQKFFRMNASAFGYESASISEVEINRDTLTPFLSSIELRELNSSRADVKVHSSASDFVRLIWSYLLALHQTSSFDSVRGNHPGILIFDEPGQHSMAESSQHALLLQLSSEKKLQSIVAASFDESDAVFREATEGVEFSLIQWDSKSIKPLSN